MIQERCRRGQKKSNKSNAILTSHKLLDVAELLLSILDGVQYDSHANRTQLFLGLGYAFLKHSHDRRLSLSGHFELGQHLHNGLVVEGLRDLFECLIAARLKLQRVLTFLLFLVLVRMECELKKIRQNKSKPMISKSRKGLENDRWLWMKPAYFEVWKHDG